MAQTQDDGLRQPATTYPRRFGRYVLLRELGRGGMGEVFMAVTGTAGVSRVCALKLMRRFQPDRDPVEMTQRFLDEAKLVTQLSHENLVYVFDFGIDDRRGYLAMEYVAGRTLAEIWNRCAQGKRGFPPQVAMYMSSELAAALGQVHRTARLALVHRDISPGNVMLAYTGGLKLIDFGLAQWSSKVAETATGIQWGKVQYMSPEQHRGLPVDHRSDLYSVGVLLWELLAGKQLFPNVDARVQTREIPPPSRHNATISPAIDRVVMRALATNPGDRYGSGEEMSAAICAVMGREPGKLAASKLMEELFGENRRTEIEEQDSLVAAAAALGDGEAAAPADPLIGATLAGRYLVKRRIGQGAMGRVYEAVHTGLGKRVAIKIPRQGERRASERLERFRREAQAASRIGHPNIADVSDCDTTPDGALFFVMELVEGEDLDDLVGRAGPLPIERALLIGLQMARAIEAAHAAGIIHRDIKPSNVKIVAGRDGDSADVVKVLDFGVAKFMWGDSEARESADLTRPESSVGTPRYMAPEQMGSGGNVDFRADIYALGGVFYFMLSGGRVPVEADTIPALWHRKLHEDATPLRVHRADLAPELEALVMRCLSRGPAERPQTMEALKRELVVALERLGTSSSATLPGPRVVVVTRPSDRRARLPWYLAAALLLGGTGAAVVWHDDATPPPPPPRVQPRPVVRPVPGPAPAPPPVTATPAAAPAPAPPRPHPAAPVAPARPAIEPELDRLLAQGEDLFQKGRFVAALTAAEKARRAGGGVRALLLAGKIHLATEEPARAVDAYEEALGLDPASEAAQRGLAKARASNAR